MEGGKDCFRNHHLLFIYFILITLAVETVYLHLRIFDIEGSLSRNINQLNKEQRSMTRKSKIGEKNLERWTDEGFQRNFSPKLGDLERKVERRNKRGIESMEKKIESILRTLTSPKHLLLQPWKKQMSYNVKICDNMTVVCMKGERGQRGKAGPRGLKGDVGGIGKPGSPGPIGPSGIRGRKGQKGQKGDVEGIGMPGPPGSIGPSGIRGRKGQKGEPGSPGRSIEKAKIMTKFPKTITKPEMSNLTLYCKGSGNPAPKIVWKFESGKFYDARYHFQDNGGIQITNIQENDQGKIMCISENILGKEVAEFKLEVHTKPRVFLRSDKEIVSAGRPIEIECNASGNPIPKLTWKKVYGSLNGKINYSLDRKSVTLKLSSGALNDSGNYICEAENYLGLARKPLHLFVRNHHENDCLAWKKNWQVKSGIYLIDPDGGNPFSVYCDMRTDGGGWTLIQRRQDGSVDFFRDWVDYKNGFGTLKKEFWLGNDKINRLTKLRDMTIRFDLEDFEGNTAFAEYKTFYIDDEANKYMVHVDTYSGTAGDSFLSVSNHRFSTKDKDYDMWQKSCAVEYHGAWWYTKCHASNLNGKYLNGSHNSYADGVNWYTFKGHKYSLKKTEMKIRRQKKFQKSI